MYDNSLYSKMDIDFKDANELKDKQRSEKECENPESQMNLSKDKRLEIYEKQVRELEIEIGNLNENLANSETEVKLQKRRLTEADKSNNESRDSEKEAKNELSEIKRKWKNIDLSDVQENSEINNEKFMKCICVYKTENQYIQNKLKLLEETIQILETEKEIFLPEECRSEKSSQLNSFLNKWFLWKPQMTFNDPDIEGSNKQKIFNELFTSYNSGKEKFLIKTKEQDNALQSHQKEIKELKGEVTKLNVKWEKALQENSKLKKEINLFGTTIKKKDEELKKHMKENRNLKSELLLTEKKNDELYTKYKESDLRAKKIQEESTKKDKNTKETISILLDNRDILEEVHLIWILLLFECL